MGRDDARRVHDAGHLFDEPPIPEAVDRFLADSGHHLLIAYEAGTPVGFVSGVEMTHPDKGTEMFLYELGVDEQYRRGGIGKALVRELAGLADRRGCYGMWTLTDEGNVAALRTYESAGSVRGDPAAMLEWKPSSPMPISKPRKST